MFSLRSLLSVAVVGASVSVSPVSAIQGAPNFVAVGGTPPSIGTYSGVDLTKAIAISVNDADAFGLTDPSSTACAAQGELSAGADNGQCFGDHPGSAADHTYAAYSYIYSVTPAGPNSVYFRYATNNDDPISCNPDGSFPSNPVFDTTVELSCNTCYVDEVNFDAFQVNCGAPIGVVGDPQFTGFLGQSFQVHGTSDTVYNILSTPTIQYNALFTYLESGRARKGTPAFSHPGNYFGSVGVAIRDPSTSAVTNVEIISGAVDAGLTMKVNNVTATPSDKFQLGDYSVTFTNQFEVLFESDEYNLRISNSDMFLNQDVSIGSKLQSKIASYKHAFKLASGNATEILHTLPHGILGQTWSRATYDNRWKHIEGQLYDYVIEDKDLFGTSFKYNRF